MPVSGGWRVRRRSRWPNGLSNLPSVLPWWLSAKSLTSFGWALHERLIRIYPFGDANETRAIVVFPGGTGVPPVLSGRDGRDASARWPSIESLTNWWGRTQR
jgi:hypothetical protein